MAPVSKLSVTNFHRLAYKFGFNKESWAEEKFGEKLKSAILATEERYDFILIDEAQDFDQGWFASVLALLKDQKEGDLFIAGDGSQGIYRRRKLSWKSEGVQAQGRTEYLNDNYRNARNIFRLASRFSGKSVFGEMEVQYRSIPQDQSRSVLGGGNIRVLTREQNRAGEVSRVVALVSKLLNDKWGPNDRVSVKPPVDFTDIGIIYPSHKGLEKMITESLIPQLEEACRVPVVWISDPKNKANRDNLSPAIRVHTVHHAKGLQYRAVIFMWSDMLPFAQGADEEHRNLFYVALTRAGQFLAITSSGPSRFVEEVIEALKELQNK